MELIFFVDGLPLHRSGLTQFWPILMRIHDMPNVPVMTVAIFCGESKPGSLQGYLQPFVTELNYLQANGLLINGRPYKIWFRAMIADTPARAYIKGVKSFNARYGCIKCKTRTTKDPTTKRTYYGQFGAARRTHEEFCNGAYVDHCKTTTPLVKLDNCDIIKDIITSEPLHVRDHGVTRRLMLNWTEGIFGTSRRWTEPIREAVSNEIRELLLPSEFQRSVRSLKYLRFWKGLEYNYFLHNISLIVLKGRISDVEYNHFMLYFCGMTLFSSAEYEDDWPMADQMLRKFVFDFATVYGVTFLSSNVHYLLHVYEDVVRFGPLHNISAYKFESHLQEPKNLLRNGRNCLAQAVNRLTELQHINYARPSNEPSFPYIVNKGNDVTAYVMANCTLKNDKKNAGLC
ncbi:uncharacterized protein LOC120899758 [Anopheles arabiensis]|uniref:uncharacterized protein LOC120899758 n=1 Tax=Anopheles arabiensis TaxID=7173 RepID=UPI001AAD8AB2|nr:uncharacterized protein LOC120899758 [Anopheles arabiensis]